MTKSLFTLILILSCFAIQSQTSDFYKATLTKKNGDTKEVYYKVREYIIDQKGNLNLYNRPNNSDKLNISSIDFSEIESEDKNISIISAIITDLDNNKPVILRKLIDGDFSLFEHINNLGESTFINKSNDTYLKLDKNVKNEDKKYYREWLYKNLNPHKNKVSTYNSLKYNREDLSHYYNINQDNTLELAQEEKVNTINLSVFSGILFNTISGDFFEIEQANSTSFKIGVEGLINLDRVTNNHSAFGRLTYYTSRSGKGSFIDNPGSQFNSKKIDTEIVLNFWSIQVGYQYNFHINNVSISPFFGFEPMFYLSNNSVDGISEEDQSQEFVIDAIKGRPVSYNLGLRISSKNTFFVLLEYNFIDGGFAWREYTRTAIKYKIEVSGFSAGIGYRFF